MSSSSSSIIKRSNIAAELFKATGRHLKTGAGEYINEIAPNTTSIIKDANSAIKEAGSVIKKHTSSIRERAKQIKTDMAFKNIYAWYTNKEDDYGDGLDASGEIGYDVLDNSSESELFVAEISEGKKNANQVSSVIMGTSKQLVETQVASTATLSASIDKQTMK